MTDAMQHLQESAHGPGHAYDPGSPHLAHPHLRAMVLAGIRGAVAEQFARHGRCRVLEIGAGHGSFTDHVLAGGAQVTLTEMSRPSLDALRDRYRNNTQVRAVFDPDGTAAFDVGEVDLVLCISVLHHIPDYLSFVDRVVDQLVTGGAFVSYQDPTWYPRRPAAAVRADRAMYLAWRLRQGALTRGLRTQARRLRGALDETNASDMTEYHVVRDGVDEQALLELLRPRFADVRLHTYFSTQGRWMQAVGGALRAPQTFGLLAGDRR